MRFGTSQFNMFRFNGLIRFSGSAPLQTNSVILTSYYGLYNPVYRGSANLNIKGIQLISSAESVLPIYSGVGNLNINNVLVAYGKNIVKGFIYNEVLYVTNTVVDIGNINI